MVVANTIAPLHTVQVYPYTRLNHVFAVAYIFALVSLFCHHILTLLHSTTLVSIVFPLSLLLSDAILAFMWFTTQAFRLRPVKRRTYPENLPSVVDPKDYPSLDVFICTADPYKEPPMNVVDTALSVMAYDYPMDKVSVYVSDDGGSVMTLFAFMEATKFAAHWLPFCREKNILERSPEAYFRSNQVHTCSKTQKIERMYASMKEKVESVVDRGGVGDEHITSELESQIYNKWTTEFTRQQHPTVIQVLLESAKDRDITGQSMPNVIYVSREKHRAYPHHFKAGALNTLLRVSATMTNAPVILTQDCDMFSNDPKTPLDALCYLIDAGEEDSNVAFVQFPQRYHGINRNDIYGSEIKRLYAINPIGMDGLSGPNYLGTGCFFRRRAFFGGPSAHISPEIKELDPSHIPHYSIQSEIVLDLAHSVASCRHEHDTDWGSKIGFRYGSLSEDYFTSFRMLCEGWKSVFCDPKRPAFLGDIPITLNDALSQTRRWVVGQLEVGFSKYNPITFGSRHMGLPMGLCFSHYAFWGLLSIPISVYAFLPPLALLNQVYLFPNSSSPLFYIHLFLSLGAYGQDLLDFISTRGTFRQWYSDQRMWMIRGISSYPFGLIDFLLKSCNISAFGFNVTSKVIDHEQSKRYEQGLFEFGVASPLFVPLTTVAIVNLIACVAGFTALFKRGNWDEIFLQLCLSGFVVLNSWPIYEAIVLRVDRGKMPTLITLTSLVLALASWSIVFLICRS